MERIKRLLDFAFGFRGRFNRLKYILAIWVVSLGLLLIGSFGAIIVLFLLGLEVRDVTGRFIFFPFLLGWLWIQVAATVKRLHDLNASGWWALAIYVGIPTILSAFFFLLLIVSLGAVSMEISKGVNLVVAAIVLVILSCVEGTVGPNKYGPDPLSRKPAD